MSANPLSSDTVTGTATSTDAVPVTSARLRLTRQTRPQAVTEGFQIGFHTHQELTNTVRGELRTDGS